MKNTFGLRRFRVRGRHPYLVRMADGSVKFLFELKYYTSDFHVIERLFTHDEVMYATVDEDVLNTVKAIDATGIYTKPEDKRRRLLYFDTGSKRFYETELVLKHNKGNTYYRFQKSDRIATDITHELVHVTDGIK